jgi:hypothetical protein
MSDDHKLAELWPTMTMNQIGDQLSISRSAIAGRVARARQAGSSQFPPKPQVRKVKPAGETVCNERPATAPEQDFVRTIETHIPAPRLLIDIPWNGCRMPVDQRPPPDNRHLMCGRPQAGHGPYCSECSAKVSVSRPLAAGQTR